MKILRICFFVLVLFSKPLFSNENSYTIQHITPHRDSIVLFLDDDSIWSLLNVKLRSQTWSEWWQNIEIEKDENFLWDNEDWYALDNVEFESMSADLFPIDSLSDNKQKEISSYQFVIRDLFSNKLAFAKPISIEELLEDLHLYAEEQYKKGYDKGFEWGMN